MDHGQLRVIHAPVLFYESSDPPAWDQKQVLPETLQTTSELGKPLPLN